MIRYNKLKIAFYFVLSCLICCYIFQLFYTNKAKDSQKASLELQDLLHLTDQVNSNLSSVQSYFKKNLLTPSPKNLLVLRSFQSKLDSLILAKVNLSSGYPQIQSHAKSIANLYKTENAVAFSLGPLAKEANPDLVIDESEKRTRLIWDQINDFEIKTKTLLNFYNKEGLHSIGSMQVVRTFSLLFALCLAVITYFLFLNSRKAAYRASSSSKAMLTNQLLLMKSLLDNTTTLMYIIDKNGKFLFANRSFLTFFDFKESEILGKTFQELDLKNDFSFEPHSIVTDTTNQTLEQEEVVYQDGKKLYFFTRKFPVKNNKNEVFASGVVCRNITERILNEEGLKKSRSDAEQAKLTQEQFMANISHEIRTPMNGIIGMSHLLGNTPLNAEQRDYLETIRLSSENLMILINDILDFSKIEAGKLELEHISFKIRDIVEQVISPLRNKISEKNLNLHVEIDHTVPSSIVGDPLRLNQIISNILSNAIKFTSKGAINLRVYAESYRSPFVKIIFEIEDTGIGIPADRVNDIFKSFTQTSLDITRRFGGTGLGLAIVKQLVDLHKATIHVESEENKGSTFTVKIPYKPAIDNRRSAEDNLKFTLLKGKRVLVVEDNFINQKVILQVLKNAGIDATLSDNGFKALDILRSETFDLVIMDIQMPDIDGCQTTIKIREELELDIPVIAMTASAMQEDRDKCQAAGMNEFISKPFVTEDLMEKMLLFIN